MPEQEPNWEVTIAALRRGDGRTIEEFCRQYGRSLERLADKHLGAGIRRRVGPEDVAQSACRTFLRRAQIGQFELPDCQALWGLLCAITLTKVREQTRFHLRQKRGLDRELQASATEEGASMFEHASPEPSPAEAAEFADQFSSLVEGLDKEERQLVDLKLQQFTNDEIAEKMGCSERTVRRILKRVQSRLSEAFGDSV